MKPKTCIKSVCVAYSDFPNCRVGTRFYAVIIRNKVMGLEAEYIKAKATYYIHQHADVERASSSFYKLGDDGETIIFLPAHIYRRGRIVFK